MNVLVRLLGTTMIFGVAAASVPAQAKPGDKIENSYICVFKAGAVAKGNARAEANRAASQGGGSLKHVYENAIRGFSTNMSASAVALLKSRNPNIAYCEQDQEVEAIQSGPLDFRVVGKPAPSQPAQTTPWGVTRVNGGSGTATGVAFVIDTGIDLTHPDLDTSSTLHRNFVARESSPNDLHGHGTHVAGTIAAKNNSIGVIGVTPGAQVVAVRVLNRRGSGSNSDVIAGVDYVAGAGQAGDVANMSLGGGPSQALDDSVKCAADGVGANCNAAGVVKFTLAAGNESESATLHSPARANGPNIYTVSSFAKGASETDTVDPWSSFSNFGNPPVDYAEPGSSILSTYKNGGYATMSGTSMAAPHLAGILLVMNPQSTTTVDGDPDDNQDPIGTK